jgi:ankyrin repeat protein
MSLLDVIKNGYFQQVRFLVDHGVDLDQRDEERRTALMLCAFIEPEAWGVGICRLLIENGATLFLKDRYGLNAFHYAVIYERLDLVRVYLKAIDFNLNEGDKQGNTALHYAVRSGNASITRLIAQMYVKYEIDFDKMNKDGFTPLQEAHRLNKRRCAKILENPDIFSDENGIEANIPMDLKSGVSERDCLSVMSSRKSLSRPRSSVLSHRSSKSSILTSEYSYRRTPTVYSYDIPRKTNRRDPAIEIPPNEKNQKKLIRCTSVNDIRNNPEFLFHMSPIQETGEVQQGAPRRHIRSKSAFTRRSEVKNDIILPKSSWRTDLRKLYVKYQYQCTASYRDSSVSDINDNASLPPLDKPITPANSEHAIDEMDTRGRRARGKSATMSRQNTEEVLTAGKNKQPQKQNPRKLSQNIGHGGKIDSALESSNESLNSATSSKKAPDGKHSKAVKDSGTGRTSRSTHHKTVPAVKVEEA